MSSVVKGQLADLRSLDNTDGCDHDNWLDYKSRGRDIKLMNIAEFVNWFNHEFARQKKN